MNNGIIVGQDMIPIDHSIVNMMVEEGFDKEALLRAISNNRHNNMTATYYLLKKKYEVKENLKQESQTQMNRERTSGSVPPPDNRHFDNKIEKKTEES